MDNPSYSLGQHLSFNFLGTKVDHDMEEVTEQVIKYYEKVNIQIQRHLKRKFYQSFTEKEVEAAVISVVGDAQQYATLMSASLKKAMNTW